MRFFVFLILLMTAAVALRAQNAPSTPAAPASSSQRSDESAALRAQLDTMWRYDQRLLNTVSYALLAILFVAGAGSVGTYLNNRREMQTLRQQIDQRLLSAVQEVNREAESQRNNVEETMKSRLSKLDTVRQTISEDLAKARTAILEEVANAELRAKASVEAESKSLQKQIAEGNARSLYRFSRFLMDHFENKPQELFDASLDNIEAQLDLGWVWYLSSDLAILMRAMERGAKVTDTRYDRFQATLKRLPGKYEIERTKILELLQKAKLV